MFYGSLATAFDLGAAYWSNNLTNSRENSIFRDFIINATGSTAANVGKTTLSSFQNNHLPSFTEFGEEEATSSFIILAQQTDEHIINTGTFSTLDNIAEEELFKIFK